MKPVQARCGIFRRRGVTLVLALLLGLTACAKSSVGTGAFRNAAVVLTQLRRGVSSKADVQKLLGVPNGHGAALFRNAPGGPREIWYYEDVEATDAAARNDVITMKLRQQIVAIFFKGDVFDGYLWTSNSSTGSAR